MLCFFSIYTNACKIASNTLQCVSKNVPPLTCYNLDIHGPIMIVFGRNVTEKVRNQTTLCFPPRLFTRKVRSCSYGTVGKVTHFMTVTDGRTDGQNYCSTASRDTNESGIYLYRKMCGC